MHTRRSAEAAAAVVAFAALAAVAALLVPGGADTAAPRASSAPAGWQGLLGDRPVPQLGDRRIVVLEAPSLADRVRRAGGVASEAEMRAWTREARRDQREALVALARRGVFVQPEFSYVRVINGFAASLDAGAATVLERQPGVAGVYPVRAAYPAGVPRSILSTPAFALGAGRRPDVRLPGFDGSGVTVALLDTGVDVAHPYLRGALLDGIDVLEPAARAVAQRHPTIPGRPERHGTELAGIIAGAGGPSGLHGVAPGASILPIRVAGWQPEASGGVAVYGRTDQVLAGLEAAVDPDGNGDTLDGVRIALVGVVEPFAAFADAPLARATAGAADLDTLVVAPAGNDGPAGPAYGSIGGPGGAAAALTVGAADERVVSPTVHVLLLAGLATLLSGEQPLGGAVAPVDAVGVPVRLVPAAAQTGLGGLPAYFDRRGRSVVAGGAALLPPGASSPEAVAEAAAAGARAVLVDGPLPAGALGLDEPLEVPILGLPESVARSVRASVRAGIPVTVSIGAADLEANPDASAVASFSSRGLSFDGSPKPELAATGVGIVTADPGRGEEGVARYGTISGTSASAAVVAGAAALLAQARPDLDADGLASALVAGARPLGGPGGPASVDLQRASAVELVSEPATLSLGQATAGKPELRTVVWLRNTSRRRIVARLGGSGPRGAGVVVRVTPSNVRLRSEGEARVTVSVSLPSLPQAPADVRGVVVGRVEGGRTLRIPWAVAVPELGKPLVGRVRLARTGGRPTDRKPWVLSFSAGRVDGSPDRPQLLALQLVDLELYRGGRRVGRLARMRDVLPGRYRVALSGRGPRGRPLPNAAYELRIVAAPVGGGAQSTAALPLVLR